MASEIARQLDELMGRNRNNPDGAELSWTSDEVCKQFLCGFCPYSLFQNTKSDLGECRKVHDEALRERYRSSEDRYKLGYEAGFLSSLESIIDELDRKIKRAYNRLQLTQTAAEDEPEDSTRSQIRVLDEKITDMISQMEKLAEEGKIDEAEALNQLVESAKQERSGLVSNNLPSRASQMEKPMQVCDVCGAFLSVGEAQSRVDAHLDGKQHVGYARIRKAIEEVSEELKSNGITSRRGGGGRDRDRDRDRDHDRDRRRDSHERSGSYRDRDRDRRYSSSDRGSYRRDDRDRHSDRDRYGSSDRDKSRYGSSDRYSSRDRDRRRSRSPR